MARWIWVLFLGSLLAICASPTGTEAARLNGVKARARIVTKSAKEEQRRLQGGYGYPQQQQYGGGGGGYPQPNMSGGGYPQQQAGGYPQQGGGYPQQGGGGYPQQQGGYPQQQGGGGYPPQQGGGYPQQGGGGYPQQQGGYPQPQGGGGYPQQQGGYPQQQQGGYPQQQQGGNGGGGYPQQQGGGYPQQPGGGYPPQQGGGGYPPQQGGGGYPPQQGGGGYPPQQGGGGYPPQQGGGGYPQQGGGYPQQGGQWGNGGQQPSWNGGVQPSTGTQQPYPGQQAAPSSSSPPKADASDSLASPSDFVAPRPMGSYEYTYSDLPAQNESNVPDDGNADALTLIDCGNLKNDTQSDWEGDFGFFTDGESEIHTISSSTPGLTTVTQTLRRFPAGFGCYRIAVPDGRYIVRMTFAHKGYDGSQLADRPKFSVLVEATEVEEVDLSDEDDDPHVTETILDINDGLVQVCLNNISTSPPIINALEIIPIDSDSYDDLDFGQDNILLTQIRFSAGGGEIFDSDPLRRDWQGDTSYLANTALNLSGAQILNAETPPGYFPNQLFETAWNPELDVIEIPVDGLPEEESEYYIRFFFAELSGEDMQAGSRVFDISIDDNVLIPRVDIYELAAQRRYYAVMTSQRFNSSGSRINITLSKTPDSTLCPILSGIELLQVVPIFRATPNPYIGGAIRIDCGSQREYTDVYDRFWDSDYGFTSGRTYNVTDVDVLAKNNLTKWMSTLRAFPYGLQNCYQVDLPVSRYLVRITGASLDLEKPLPTMGIIIEGAPTRLTTLQQFSSESIDFIVYVGDNELDVCFYRNVSAPVINSLQMIQMDSNAYGADRKGIVLNKFYWINCGGPRLGFPDQEPELKDNYERQWLPDVQTTALFSPNNSLSYQASDQSIQIRNAETKPFDYPAALYRTVRYSDSGNLNYTLYVWNAWTYTVYLHFVELNTSIQKGDRVFDVLVQDVPVVSGLDVMYMAGGHNVAYVVNQSGVSVLTDDSGGVYISISLISRPESKLTSPTIAGIEVYSEIDIPSPTRAADLDAMMELRRQLQIPEAFGWNGDPCVPSPFWTGVDCNVYTDRREATVKSIVLEGYGIRGTLPAELGNLTYLEVLGLSHNFITGSIPPEIGKCSNLTTLDLSHNQFTGPIPNELSSIPSLVNVSVNDNQLNGPVPVDLASRKNVKILLANNPGLCGYDGLPQCSVVTNATGTSKREHHLSGGQVAGVVVGCVGFILLAGAIVGGYLYKKRSDKTGYTLAETLSTRKYPYEKAYSGKELNGSSNNTLEMGRRVQLADDY